MTVRALALLLAAEPGAAAPAVSSAISVWPYVAGAVAVIAVGGALLALSLRRGKKAPDELCANCGRVMMADWPRCMFCKTPRGFKKAQLQFVSGPLAGRTVELEAEVTTIGSAEGTTVRIPDQGVSRKHAGIRKADGGYEVADLGSTNGVYVNGEKTAKRRLQSADVIRVGTTEIVFRG